MKTIKKIFLSSLPVIAAVLILFIVTLGVSVLDSVQAQIDKATANILSHKNKNVLPTASNDYDNEHKYQYYVEKRAITHS